MKKGKSILKTKNISSIQITEELYSSWLLELEGEKAIEKKIKIHVTKRIAEVVEEKRLLKEKKLSNRIDTDHIKYFLDYMKIERGLAPLTIIAYERELQNFSRFLSEKEDSEMDRHLLIEFFVKKMESGLNPKSVRLSISILRSFFRFLVNEEFVKSDPTIGVKYPKCEEKLPKILTIDEMIKLIEAPMIIGAQYGYRDSTIIETLYATGMRVSELTNLKLYDLKLNERYIKIEQGKGSKDRIIPIHEICVDRLRYYLKNVREFFLKKGFQDFVFLANHGEGFSRIAIFKKIKSYAEKAGITKNIHPHTIRHSFATHLMENDIDIRCLQLILGHTDISTVGKYIHLSQTKLRKSYDKFHSRA